MTEPKPIEFWRKRIEEKPGSVRLRTESGVIFIPFFFVGNFAHGKDGNGISQCWPTHIDVWVEDKPKIVRWLWANANGAVSNRLLSEYESQNYGQGEFKIKLEWSRTESDL